MKKLLVTLGLIASGSIAFGQEPDLVDGAKQAIAYWHSLFLQCSNSQGGTWYALSPDGSIQTIPELRIQFRTEELSPEERLNGVELKAVTHLDPGPFRWWIASKKAWRDWQVGEIAPPRVLIKKKGVWSDEAPPNRHEDRKAISKCSDVPPMENNR
jgi:hypothetical protein